MPFLTVFATEDEVRLCLLFSLALCSESHESHREKDQYRHLVRFLGSLIHCRFLERMTKKLSLSVRSCFSFLVLCCCVAAWSPTSCPFTVCFLTASATNRVRNVGGELVAGRGVLLFFIFLFHKSSYWRRCIRWMMSRQSLNTRRMFSVSTAQVKCG